MLLSGDGKVSSLGRTDYGVLGIGETMQNQVRVPTAVEGSLFGKFCVEISCGTSVSYAVTTLGEVFSWGMGSNKQVEYNLLFFHSLSMKCSMLEIT
jgi:regulator of chromosome condensation